MHPFWGAVTPETLSRHIQVCSKEGDILLDPFGGSAAAAVEALRLGRRIAICDPNPLTAFMTEVVLKPVSLPRLRWAFQDVETTCRGEITRDFQTACPACGKSGTIEYVLRRDGQPVQIAYRCACERARLYKTPDAADRRAATVTAGRSIPFRVPADIPFPLAGHDIPASMRDLYTGRTLAGLALLRHVIGGGEDPSARDVLKLAFATILEPGCRARLRPPVSARSSGRKKTVADPPSILRLPSNWREVNPWIAFEDAYHLLYEGKRTTNAVLQKAVFGRGFRDLESGQADILLLHQAVGRSRPAELPDDSIDCVLAATPVHPLPEDSPVFALWEAWLSRDAPEGGRVSPPAAAHEGEERRADFAAIRRTAKDGGCAHFFFDDRPGTPFHSRLNLLAEYGLMPERIIHQPATGAYAVRCTVHKKDPMRSTASDAGLRRRLAAAAKARLIVSGGETPGDLLRHVYGQLDAGEIRAFAAHPPKEQLAQAVSAFADYRDGQYLPRRNAALSIRRKKALAGLQLALLDLESIAPGDPRTAQEARRALLGGWAPAGFSSEDLEGLRKSLDRRRIDQHRRSRFTVLLRELGKALGYRSGPAGKGASGVVWNRTAAGEIRFDFLPTEVRVCSRQSRKDPVAWGSISYFDLERSLHEWCRSHAELGGKLARRLVPGLDSAGHEEAGRWMTPSPIADLRLKVVRNRKICADHYLLEARLPGGSRLVFLPGQFFHVICDPDDGKEEAFPLTLRRPFSIHGAQYAGFPRGALAGAGALPLEIRRALVRRPVRIDFLYRVVGEGTRALSQIRNGARLDAIGPLGNGFTIGGERTAVLVAGGIGVAPLIALAQRLRYLGKDVLIYLGAMRKEMLGLAVSRPLSANGPIEAVASRDLLDAIRSDFLEIGAQVLTVCTDDGSAGEKGLVTEMLEQGIGGGCVPLRDVRLYACGPEGMLKAVAQIAARHSLECEVSLEERMACGIGACYSCTCRVAGPDGAIRKKRVCRDGPVFQARDIQWKD